MLSRVGLVWIGSIKAVLNFVDKKIVGFNLLSFNVWKTVFHSRIRILGLYILFIHPSVWRASVVHLTHPYMHDHCHSVVWCRHPAATVDDLTNPHFDQYHPKTMIVYIQQIRVAGWIRAVLSCLLLYMGAHSVLRRYSGDKWRTVQSRLEVKLLQFVTFRTLNPLFAPLRWETLYNVVLPVFVFK